MSEFGSLTVRYIIWDFDGTLACRPGMWSGTLLEILHRELPDCTSTIEDIRPYMRTGFPWHSHEQPHNPIKSADEWWECLLPVFERAFREGAQLDANESQRLARQVRTAYVNPEAWELFADTIPCLEMLQAQGWRHLILSNHVPELPDIIEALGLAPFIAQVFNSAQTGFEKPHPEAFRSVLATIADATEIWMVGDNFSADVMGAQAIGLPAVLVRSAHSGAGHCCRTLDELPGVLNDGLLRAEAEAGEKTAGTRALLG